MDETLQQLFHYVRGVWRFRWLALACAWLLAVAGWLLVYQMPNSYVATARIYVDSNTVLAPLLQGLAIRPNIEQRIKLMSRTLLSRPNLEKMMRMADLDLRIRNDLEKEEFLEDLRDRISLSGERGDDTLYSVAFQDPDRDVAKRIVQALITVFIESSLGDKREDSTDAQSFLDEQIADYEVRLNEAEQRLADFKQRYVGTLPGQQGDYYTRLQTAKNELRDATLALKEVQNRSEAIRRQLSGEEPMLMPNALVENRVTSSLDGRIQALQVKRDSLLAVYTEKHPEVRQITALIEELEKEKTKEIAGAKPNQPANYSGLTSSPAYEGMRSMLAASEAEAASLQTRVDEYTRRVKDLEEKVNNIPNIEAELLQLDRDYEVVLKQHQTLLARRESAMISQRVEQNATDVTFRVVDPPYVPLTPSEPNKLLLNAAVLFGAMGAGIALALLVSLINPVVGDSFTLAQLAGLPVLGSVHRVMEPIEKRRRLVGQVVFVSILLLLVCGFAGVTILEQQMMPSA